MSLTKRIKGDYLIETVDTGANDTITFRPSGVAGSVVIDGDLSVLGTTTTIASIDTEIVDNTIVLNSGEVGNGVTAGESGIEVDRGTASPAGFRFNETTNAWQVNNGDGSWLPVVAGAAGILAVVDDTTPQLGGTLDVNGWTITSTAASDGSTGANGADIVISADATGQVKLDDRLLLQEETVTTNYNQLYADTVGTGGTGLYYQNTAGTDDELVSKTKAIAYSLIF